MEAAASPLPSDETTPPVTKMYLTGLDSFVCISSTPNGARGAPSARARALRLESCADALEVRRRVNADALGGGLHRRDPVAVLQHAQLFEHLGVFERRRRKLREPQQELPPVHGQAD